MENFRDILKVQGIKAKGYGIIPKMVMLDRKLTVEAKAIYSYFCSYAGAGDTAFPSRNKICDDLCIGVKRYYNHFKLLVDLGYIEVEQTRHKSGKFKHNVYTLTDKPIPVEKVEPSGHEGHSDSNVEIKPSLPSGREGHTDKAHTDNSYSNSNNLYKSNNTLYNQSINHSKKDEKIKENERMNDNINTDDLDKEFQDILNNISIYEFGLNAPAIEQSLRLLHYSDKPLLNNNILVQPKTVRDDLKRLKWEHVDLAVRDLQNASESIQIRNISSYLSKCIYNSIFNSNLKLEAEINYNRS